MVKDKKIVLARTKVYGSKLLLIDEKATLKILKNILQGPETIVFIAHNWSKELHGDRKIVCVRMNDSLN